MRCVSNAQPHDFLDARLLPDHAPHGNRAALCSKSGPIDGLPTIQKLSPGFMPSMRCGAQNGSNKCFGTAFCIQIRELLQKGSPVQLQFRTPTSASVPERQPLIRYAATTVPSNTAQAPERSTRSSHRGEPYSEESGAGCYCTDCRVSGRSSPS